MQGGWDAIAQLRGDGLHRNSRLAEARAVHYYATFAERGQWFKENAPDLNFSFTPWPKPEGGKDANLGGNHTATFAINAPNPDAMFAWFEYFLSPRYEPALCQAVRPRAGARGITELLAGWNERLGRWRPGRRFVCKPKLEGHASWKRTEDRGALLAAAPCLSLSVHAYRAL